MRLAIALWTIMAVVLGLALYVTPSVRRTVSLEELINEEPLTYEHHEVRCNSIAPPVQNQLCSRGRWTQGI